MDFVARTRKSGGSLIISVPHELKLEEAKEYQFSVNPIPVHEKNEVKQNESEAANNQTQQDHQ